MTEADMAAALQRWRDLKAYATARGVPYAVVLGIVGRIRGKFQSYDRLSQKQYEWCRERVDEEAAKGIS